jgi:ketosteroid isomerase-like protein
MSPNEMTIRELYTAAEGKVRDTGKFVSLFAPAGYFMDMPSGQTWIGAEVRKPIEALYVAFPDMHREWLNVHAAGDIVAVELKLQGTHLGDYHVAGGILPATGRSFDVPCCDVFRLEGGKVMEFRCYSEVSTWLDQLGCLHDLDASLRR